MPKGIFIPADSHQPLELREFNGLKDLQAGVGGLIEPLDIDRPAATLFCNEEALYMDLKMNGRATLLLWLHLTRYRGRQGLIGDVVLFGQPDDDGETQDVPAWYTHLLLEANHFKVQKQTIDDMLWRECGYVFDDWEKAYVRILVEAEQDALINHVRVVPA